MRLLQSRVAVLRELAPENVSRARLRTSRPVNPTGIPLALRARGWLVGVSIVGWLIVYRIVRRAARTINGQHVLIDIPIPRTYLPLHTGELKPKARSSRSVIFPLPSTTMSEVRRDARIGFSPLRTVQNATICSTAFPHYVVERGGTRIEPHEELSQPI